MRGTGASPTRTSTHSSPNTPISPRSSSTMGSNRRGSSASMIQADGRLLGVFFTGYLFFI